MFIELTIEQIEPTYYVEFPCRLMIGETITLSDIINMEEYYHGITFVVVNTDYRSIDGRVTQTAFLTIKK